MQVDEEALSQSHSLIRLSVISSTQISTRVSQILEKLGNVTPDGKPVIIALASKSKVASKLISIVEIVKRELTAKNIKCYQYNALLSQLITVENNPENRKNDNTEKSMKEADGEDSDEAFQTMGESGQKQKTVPFMTTYLSVQPVKELKGLG